MATIVREYLLQDLTAEDEGGYQARDPNGAWVAKSQARFLALVVALRGVKCNHVTRSGRACGRALTVTRDGFVGCRYHETYEAAIAAIAVVDAPAPA